MFTSHLTFENASALHQQGQLVQARTICEQLIAAESNHADALHLLGIIDYQSGYRERAVQFFSRATNADPTRADFFVNHANVLYELKQFAAAIDSYNKAIALTQNDAVVYLNRGLALTELNRWGAAVDSYQSAINIKPDFAESYFNLGNALRELGQLENAVKNYDCAIAITPDYADAYFNRGNVLLALGQREKAMESFNRAIAIKPNYAKAYFNRGCILLDLRQPKKAVESFDHAIAITPTDATFFINRGLALVELKRWQAAFESYDHAISIQPDFAQAYQNKAVALLATNHFEEGWPLYEWRLKCEKPNFHPKPISNAWDGKKLTGSLLVLPEQGMGDEIFYSNMLNELRPFSDHVTACVDPRLIPLYQRSFENINFISRQSPPPVNEFDAQIYMASLGRFFRANQHALQNITSPYLRACPHKTKELRGRLKDKKIRCGLSWVSTNADFGPEKTLRLQDLTSVLALPDIEFINLQYGDTTAEQIHFFNETGIKLTHVAEVDNYSDIDGLAALIDACDVIVTISNTTAHLAAALGKNVIVMLPFAKGLLWYWHEEEDKTPWYPTARLVRQPESGDWAEVVARVRTILENI